MERRNNFVCVLLFQLIFNKNVCFLTCRIPVPRDLRFIAVQGMVTEYVLPSRAETSF